MVGTDSAGDWILEVCRQNRIGVSSMHRTDSAPTSYTDVMTVASTGRRTFFHQRGANALLRGSEIQLESSSAKLFHLGYLLLLDSLDAPCPTFGTKSAELLHRASELGFVTSADVVSEESDRYRQIVFPPLRHLDLLFMNEFEAGRMVDSKIRIGDAIDRDALISTADIGKSRCPPMGHYPFPGRNLSHVVQRQEALSAQPKFAGRPNQRCYRCRRCRNRGRPIRLLGTATNGDLPGLRRVRCRGLHAAPERFSRGASLAEMSRIRRPAIVPFGPLQVITELSVTKNRKQRGTHKSHQSHAQRPCSPSAAINPDSGSILNAQTSPGKWTAWSHHCWPRTD
jgi:pfkB family carbohydrate kinase